MPSGGKRPRSRSRSRSRSPPLRRSRSPVTGWVPGAFTPAAGSLGLRAPKKRPSSLRPPTPRPTRKGSSQIRASLKAVPGGKVPSAKVQAGREAFLASQLEKRPGMAALRNARYLTEEAARAHGAVRLQREKRLSCADLHTQEDLNRMCTMVA